MSHQHPSDKGRAAGALAEVPLVITLRTDSYECPDCGVIVVATDDMVSDLALWHECG
jgi:predicted RNA-binding Zn-ribbon protein involved in translation (DUF1610 family)